MEIFQLFQPNPAFAPGRTCARELDRGTGNIFDSTQQRNNPVQRPLWDSKGTIVQTQCMTIAASASPRKQALSRVA